MSNFWNGFEKMAFEKDLADLRATRDRFHSSDATGYLTEKQLRKLEDEYANKYRNVFGPVIKERINENLAGIAGKESSKKYNPHLLGTLGAAALTSLITAHKTKSLPISAAAGSLVGLGGLYLIGKAGEKYEKGRVAELEDNFNNRSPLHRAKAEFDKEQ